MDDFEKELKAGFLDEASQLLTDAEQCFLNLETADDDPSIIEKLFRLAHNLKGSARAVGFADIAEFTHQLESLLLKIKNKELKIHDSTVTLLLQCNDHLRMMVDTLRANMDARVDSTQLLGEIGRHLTGQVQEAAAAPAETAPETPSDTETEAEVQAALDVANACDDTDGSEPAAEAFPPASAFGDEPKFEELDAVVQQSLQQAQPAAPASNEGPRLALVPAAEAAAPVDTASPKVAPNAPAPGGATDESIRVSLKRLERLMNNVGELVILQAVLNQQKHQVQSLLIQKTIDQLAKITKDIQDISMSLRMVPLKQTFQKMNRIVRDTSKALNKQVRLELAGEDTELDKTLLEQVGDPLVHLVRNAVDHGLEMPQDRLAKGKSEEGVVKLSAYHQGSHIVLEVRDDGWGLDPKKLIAKATEKGIVKPGQQLSDEQAYQLIFASGFSTKEAITDISGRGVGMDVVRNNISALQGEIQVETELGKGTCFRVLLPLTLSIIDGMVVRYGEERYVVPIAQVHESVQPHKEDVHHVTGMGEVLSLRGENLPLYRLGPVLGRKASPKQAIDSTAIVVRNGKQAFAFLVDDIIGHQQVVIKRLGHGLQNLKGISGGAILGDGRAALIIDFNELVSKGNQQRSAPAQLKGVA